MTSAATPPAVRPAQAIPWYLWCSALAVTSAYIGGYWDISWHRSIGRDSFWSPPHVAIYACGVLAGLSSGYLVVSTTFGARAPLRAVSVRIWGLWGPLGAFISAWGGIAMPAPMAAIEIATPSGPSHDHPGAARPATVSFPYGFPEPGDYKIFVQVKRGGRIETGAFDAHVQ